MKNFSKTKKILKRIPKSVYAILLVFLFAILTISVPSLARFERRSPLDFDTTWDGTVATSYRSGSGTKNDPYIISDGKELAYFAQMLETTNYANTYFELGSNIILNDGFFSYEPETDITYEKDNTIYYVKAYTEEVYTDKEQQSLSQTLIHRLPSLQNFAGNFDGNAYTIYGAYITSNSENEVGLFTNLTGTVHDVYVSNSLVYGGNITGGIASSISNGTIKNTSYDGFVITKNNPVLNTVSIAEEIPLLTIGEEETNITNTLTFALKNTEVKGNIKEIKLSGKVTKTSDTSILKINDTVIDAEDFSITLPNSYQNEITYSLEGTPSASATFTDVTLTVSYEYMATGGIIGEANNGTLKNVYNEGHVYGHSFVGGLVGSTKGELNITDTYNKGNINASSVAGGLIGYINQSKGDTKIERSYNTGEVTSQTSGGLIGAAVYNERLITVTFSFDASTSAFKIGQNIASTINVNNLSSISGTLIEEGKVNGSLTITTEDNLKSATYLNSFLSFIDLETLETAPNRVWLFEENEYPILYFDDIKNPLAKIQVGTSSWDTLAYSVNTLYYNKNQMFTVVENSSINPLKKIEYSLVNTDTPLTYEEITLIDDWQLLEESAAVSLTEEGHFLVYVRLTDKDDEVHYLNTDLLVIDKTAPVGTISAPLKTYNSLLDTDEPYYITSPITITIEGEDEISNIKSISYYLTNEKKSLDELTSLDINWQAYQSGVRIETRGKNYVYAKIENNAGLTTYLETDALYYTGYTVSDTGLGIDGEPNENFTMTNNSSFHTRFTYQDEYSYFTASKHELLVNVLLKENTMLTLIDNINEKIYTYEITNEDFGYNDCSDATCYMRIPFTVFKEVGKENDTFYTEPSNGPVKEDYTILVDFANASNSEFSPVNLSLALTSEDAGKTRNTLASSNHITVKNETAKVDVEVSKETPIYYNSNSVTNILLTPNISVTNNVFDTVLANQNKGVEIWLTNEEGEIVAKKYWQTMSFQIGEEYYYPEENGILYLPLNNPSTLSITTHESTTLLPVGTYTLHLRGYTSVNKYPNVYSETETTIPLYVTKEAITFHYGLEVEMANDYQILNKTNSNVTLPFTINYTGELQNPNIRVSLSKKSQLTAYNQDYEMIDLQDYVTSTLDKATEKSYYVTRLANAQNEYQINMDLTNLSSGGYAFVFALYDGDVKIGEISKKVIVR